MLGLVSVVLLGIFTLPAGAQTSTANFFPVMLKNQTASGAEALGTAFVGEVSMPFTVLDGVQPDPEPILGGGWLITTQRVDSGDQNGTWLVVIDAEGRTGAVHVETEDAATRAVEPIPGGPLSPARGSVASRSDGSCYSFSWQSTSGRTRALRIYRVTGVTCES